LAPKNFPPRPNPVLSAANIHYDMAERTRAISCGGIGAIHLLARQTGLIEALDAELHLLKVHLPYHESDHVLNIAYNLLAGGNCLEDLELRRNDEVYLDALGACRIPDPTTAGDFCRRFSEESVNQLMRTINSVRLKVWKQQPPEFFQEAIIEADGTMAPTTGECKGGMDISHDGQWGYHPLVLSLANTKEPLFLVNRPGNRPSHEGAAERFDQGIELCNTAGFKRILLRGDTDFSQTQHLDRWDAAGNVTFLFGIDAMKNLVGLANDLPPQAWGKLQRPEKYEVQTTCRARPEKVKEQVVKQREFKNLRLKSEDVAEFAYRPTACAKAYRVVVVRKNLSVEKGELALYEEIRYFFYITNDRQLPAETVVLWANDRCDQENLHAQLKGGCHAMNMPVNDLVSNWAYMVMASLAWSLKAWFALLSPAPSGRWQCRYLQEKRQLLKMEFKTFLNAVMLLPCQLLRCGRRIVYRLLSWNPWQSVLLRLIDRLCRPLRC
jgi:hypothetical protein